AGNGLSDGTVDDLVCGYLAILAEVFSDAVHDDDRFVDRVPQNGQYTGQYREREFPLEDGKKAQNDDDVVQVGHHAGNGKLPFKSETQVHHDADDHKQQRHQAVVHEFFAHLRTYEFDPT